jgi:DNA polymerase-1
MTKRRWTWASVPTPFEPYWQYAALDPVLTARVAGSLWPEVQPYRQLYEQEVALEQLLTGMEARGVAVDVDYCEIERHKLLAQAEEIAHGIESAWGVSAGSNDQIAAALERDGHPIYRRTRTGKASVDEAALGQSASPLAAEVLRHRGLVKVANTYLKNFVKYADADGRAHCSVNQVQARTGRMSVSRPSLQNIPRTRLARWAFTAAEGNRLVLADFDQIEMRLLAHYAQEGAMIQAIRDGVDLHTFTAQRAYGVAEPTRAQRQVAKSSNFAILYGAGAAKFSETAGIPIHEGQAFLNMYREAFPGVAAFTRGVRSVGQRRLFAEGEGYVTTWGGRRLPSNPDKLFTLVNYLIQGSARDVMGSRMLAMASAGLDEYMTLPVHDEVVMDVPAGLVEDVVETIARVMPDNDSFAVPISAGVDVVDRWGEKYTDD